MLYRLAYCAYLDAKYVVQAYLLNYDTYTVLYNYAWEFSLNLYNYVVNGQAWPEWSRSLTLMKQEQDTPTSENKVEDKPVIWKIVNYMLWFVMERQTTETNLNISESKKNLFMLDFENNPMFQQGNGSLLFDFGSENNYMERDNYMDIWDSDGTNVTEQDSREMHKSTVESDVLLGEKMTQSDVLLDKQPSILQTKTTPAVDSP